MLVELDPDCNMSTPDEKIQVIQKSLQAPLIVECGNHGLSTSGSKEDLPDRFIIFLSDNPEANFAHQNFKVGNTTTLIQA